MIFRSSSALVAILTLSTADAFGIRTAFHQKSASIGYQFPVTSLGMSDEGTTEPADTPSTEGDDSAEAPAADVNDILSSPAFLKRKLEVLESDIATTEEELAAATERKEIAKEEWGPQIEALQREVS